MEFTQKLQAVADREVGKRRTHNIVLGMQSADGRVDAVAAAGHADAAGSVAMTPETPYYVASVTKMYTAAVIMQLAGSGKVDLEAPISAYLPSELLAGTHVVAGQDHSGLSTVSQLLAQTSGLADYFEGKPKGGSSFVDELKAGNDIALTVEQILDIVRGLPPDFAPGEEAGRKARYSDTNYTLLGAIIEAVTASTVAENFRERIFAPLGLKDTSVAGTGESTTAMFFFKDRPIDIPLAMASFAPDGGVISTVADSMRFLRAFFGGELLNADELSLMTRRWNRVFFPIDYGMGLMRYKPPRWMSPFADPPELIGHSGSTGSFSFYNPTRELFIAGTVNQMDSPSRPYRIISRVLRLSS